MSERRVLTQKDGPIARTVLDNEALRNAIPIAMGAALHAG
jgi:hypothetical protein